MDVSSPYRSITWTVERFADSLLREMEEHRKVVGQRLRDLRKQHGMNQEDAAHAVGVAVKTWSNWERGATAPYDSNWKKIGDTFGVDPASIIGTPPAPLGLGHNPAGNPGETPDSDLSQQVADLQNQVDAQDAKLDEMNAKLDRLLEFVDSVNGQRLLALLQQAAAPPVAASPEGTAEAPHAEDAPPR